MSKSATIWHTVFLAVLGILDLQLDLDENEKLDVEVQLVEIENFKTQWKLGKTKNPQLILADKDEIKKCNINVIKKIKKSLDNFVYL